MLTRWSLPPGADHTWLTELVADWRTRRAFQEPFNLRLKGGLTGVLPRWERVPPDEIDLEYHLRHTAIPKPGGRRELDELASRLHSPPMDLKRPLWEVHVIEGLGDNEFAMYCKLHHTQFDGMGTVSLLDRVFSADPEERDMPPMWEAPGRATVPIDLLGLLRRNPVKMMEEAVEFTRAIGDMQLSSSEDNAAIFSAPMTPLNRPVRLKKKFFGEQFALARLRRVSKALGVTGNDVAVALTAEALRRYLLAEDALPDRSLVVGIPVSIRDKDNAAAANAISFILARMHTDVEDPVERLRAIHRSTVVGKKRLQGLPTKGAREAFGTAVAGPQMAPLPIKLGGRFAPAFTLMVSNVPGPREPRYFDGARMTEFWPLSVVLDGQGINVTMVTYAGTCHIGVTVCHRSVPNAGRIAKWVGEALVQLEEALGFPAGPQSEG